MCVDQVQGWWVLHSVWPPKSSRCKLLVRQHMVTMQVVDQRNSNDYAMKQSEFFKAFRAGGDRLKGNQDPLMLKVKDYPPDAAFAEQMPRHWQVLHYLLAIGRHAWLLRASAWSRSPVPYDLQD